MMNAINVTLAALRVATATTQSSAASCMLLPMLEPIAPTQKTRKSWKESARSDRGSGRVRSGSSAGACASNAAWVTPRPGLPGRDAGDLDGLGVLPGPEERAGPVARQRSARDDLGPVDEDVLDALGLGVQPARARRQVVARVNRTGAHAVLVEHHADLDRESFRAYRRSFPVLSGRSLRCAGLTWA